MSHPDAPPLAVRRRGFLAGVPIGAALAARTAANRDAATIRAALDDGPRPLAPPAGRRYAAVALGDGLLEELLSGGVDLQRLAGRWTSWLAADGHDADAALVEALGHLRDFNAPADQLQHTGAAALVAALPAGLAAASPRSMVSGAFHTARMLDPDPASGLAAVAMVLTASRFLEGSRDVLPEVLGLLRSNDAPATVYDRFAAIVREPRVPPVPPRGPDASAVDVAVWALRIVQHQPRGAPALRAMVSEGGISSTAGGLLGGLLGARDGIDEWPAPWRDGAGEDVLLRSALADTLGR